jgi:hypothetical protein
VNEKNKKRIEQAYERAMLQAALDEADRLGRSAGMEMLEKQERALRAMFAEEFKAALKREVKALAENAAKRSHIEVFEE